MTINMTSDSIGYGYAKVYFHNRSSYKGHVSIYDGWIDARGLDRIIPESEIKFIKTDTKHDSSVDFDSLFGDSE